MKKSYVKPQVYFENFQLSANIATGCGIRVNYQENVCSLIPGMNLFTLENNCDYVPEEHGQCYQTISDENRLFTS